MILPTTVTAEDLMSYLRNGGIKWKKWNKAGPGSLENLLREIWDEKTQILINEGKVERHTRSAVIDVCCESRKKLKKLTKKGRRGTSGRHSLHETITLQGDPAYTVINCLNRLGLSVTAPFIPRKQGESPISSIKSFRSENPQMADSPLVTKVCTYELESLKSESFPDLPTMKELCYFLCIVPKGVGKKPVEGYVWREFKKDECGDLFVPRN